MENPKLFVGPLLGQFIYFEKIEAAEPAKRRAMARAALNVSGESAAYPILLSEVVNGLGWDEYQAVVGMLSLHSHLQLAWNEVQLLRLRHWAA